MAKNKTPSDPPKPLWDILVRTVLDGPGRVAAAIRRRAAAGEGDSLVGEFAARVRHRAFTVTDEHIAALRAAGLDDDAIFEVAIASAVGAAAHRLDVGMNAVAAAAEKN